MENNHTDISSVRGRETAPRKPIEAPKRERISIMTWMSQTLDEMKRRTGWFKESPEVTRIQRLSADYPNVQAEVTEKVGRIHRRADVALAEAESELAAITGKSVEPAVIADSELEPVEIEQPYRLLRIPEVDTRDREAWREVKYQVIQEFDAAFAPSKVARRPGDFEVDTWIPTSTTNLKQMREQGKQRIRVRSESIGGVRVDALVDAKQPDQWLEFRVYETSGHFVSLHPSADPVNKVLETAEYNANALHYAKQARQRRREGQVLLSRYSPEMATLLTQPLTGQEVIQAEDWRLALPQDYEQESARALVKSGGKNIPNEPKIGPTLAAKNLPAEPAIGVLSERHQPYMEDGPSLDRTDRRAKAMGEEYGLDVMQRLEEHLFATQEAFDRYFKLWELATHNQNVEPAQAGLIAKVFKALQAEGKKRGLMDKGSYAYVVEAYRNIENDLPKLKESIETVKELRGDATTAAEEATYQKELNYLNHLRLRAESEQSVSLHSRVEQFLENYQHEFTLAEIGDIWAADAALDAAGPKQVEAAKIKLLEAMDFPARLVLSKQIEKFLGDYDRFMPEPQKAAFRQQRDDLELQPGLINFWDRQVMLAEVMSTIRGRAWDRVAMESIVRLTDVLQQYDTALGDVSFPLVSKLRDQLTKALAQAPGGKMDLEGKVQIEQILRYFEPVEFERYLSTLLSEVTGKDMRPAWAKTDAELAAGRSSETFVHDQEHPANETIVMESKTEKSAATPVLATWEEDEPGRQAPTPVEVEWEMEDLSEEIPGLVRALRGVRATPEESAMARQRGREILEQAGSEEIIEITAGMLGHLDKLRSLKRIDNRVYGRAMATLLSADNFNAREEAIRTLSAELPTTFLHPLGQHPSIGEVAAPGQKTAEYGPDDSKKIA